MVNKFYFESGEAGGVGRYFFELTKLLEENGHTIVPFAMKHSKNLPSVFEKYFVSEVKTKPSWNLWQDLKTVGRFFWSLEARRKLKKLIKENGPFDVAHIHNIYHQISPSILPVLKKKKIPVVMTVHDYKLISPNYNLYLRGKIYDKICGSKFGRCFFDRCINNSFTESLICSLEMWFHHRVLDIYRKNIDLFIAPSIFVKEKLIAAGYDRNKIKIVPHFCNPSGPIEYRTTSPSKGEDSVGNYLLYFGRVSEEKGIGVLIEAMKQLPELKLKIAGEGPEFRHYGLLITNYQLQNTQLLGHKNIAELQNLIKGAYLIIVPSLSPETFGLSALESMAQGKCVVASDIGALPELIDNNFLFSPGNVFELVELIKKLTNDVNSVIENGEENRKKVEQLYDKGSHYTKILGVYNYFDK
ncbi:MAG: glycosyltransferase family 4 protein [Patescibacteria group bacterium]|nr:glycosyltransferase family 4 protein [Patescibacteria group bacterium]